MLARLLTESLHKHRVDGSIDPAPVTCPRVGLPDEPLISKDGGLAGNPAAAPVVVSIPFPCAVPGPPSRGVAIYNRNAGGGMGKGTRPFNAPTNARFGR